MRMTSPDNGVRGMHLSGKPLVFLFMAVTVASVVIFLCGVLVGRGVQARSAVIDAPVIGAAAPDADPPPTAGEPAAPVPSGPTSSADVTFPKRLTDAGTSPEKLVTPPKNPPPGASAPAPVPAPAMTPAAAPPAPPAAASAAVATPTPPATATPLGPAPPPAAKAPERPAPGIPTEPRGAGYAIQVAALNGRDEAESMVKRLTGKGYTAYILAPQAGQPTMFRVRVGKFQERAEAEKVATRLEREELFKPWITR
jgi:DedD protein